jgi:hypothetical protein
MEAEVAEALISFTSSVYFEKLTSSFEDDLADFMMQMIMGHYGCVVHVFQNWVFALYTRLFRSCYVRYFVMYIR